MGEINQPLIKKLYEERLSKLEKDLTDVFAQLNRTENAQSRNNLQRQIEEIEQEMNTIQQKLKSISQTKVTAHPLLQILKPYVDSTITYIKRAYQACCPQGFTQQPDTVEGILEILQDIRDNAQFAPIERFVAHLVVNSNVPQHLVNTLQEWGRENIQQFDKLLNDIKQVFSERSQISESYLLVKIKASGKKSKSNQFQLSAWLIPDVQNYQPEMEQGYKQLPIWQEEKPTMALKFPVVTLEPESLTEWARVVAGAGSVQTLGILFEQNWKELVPKSPPTPQQPTKPDLLVKRFHATASPLARKLAGFMAAAPVSLPVIHLIQQELLPESRQIHLAEIFMSGLLQFVQSHKPSQPERWQYKFVDGVREILLSSVRITEIDAVLEAVSQYIARKAGLQIKSFAALLAPNPNWDISTRQEVIPFAKIAMQVLRQLGEDYAALAEQLEQTSPVIPEFSEESHNPPKILTFEFEVATITIEAETETPLGINLQPFEFEVALIEVNKSAQISTGSFPEIVDEMIFTKTGKHLNDIERLILQGTLVNQTYEKISESTKYSARHLRNVALKLWEVLSEVLGEKVDKRNLQNALKRWAARRRLTIHCHRQRATEFIEDLGNGVQLEMVAIPSGNFLMGSPEDEPKRLSDESPQHTVTIKSFFIGKYPVTQAQWQAVASLPQVNRELDADPSRFKGENRPVEQVSWYDAIEFCDRLSQYTGKPYRLPSEAEWEYACRAGSTTPFHFGETITSELANYDANYRYSGGVKGVYRGETTPVGSFGVANAFGLYDMHGNVWEWCADHWHENYEGAPTDGSVWLDDTDNDNALQRGSSWLYSPDYCRSACRVYGDAGVRRDNYGFRVVCAVGWSQ